jgi:Holliday junction resolvasome RuvABC ATP-dependent DNA helicase subunit
MAMAEIVIELMTATIGGQLLGVLGWLFVASSLLFLVWTMEPCITRQVARCVAPPVCVQEVGNVPTRLSRLRKFLKRATTAKGAQARRYHPILLPEGKERFVELESTAREALVSKSPFAHLIFHGPRGAGKFSAAKYLADSLAIPYILVSGASLAAGSSNQIDALISWGNTFSRGKGIIVYIDEAEAFLAGGTREKVISKFTGVLDGVRRDLFIILSSTRDAQDLDTQIVERCETMKFTLPSAMCRRELLLYYFEEHIASFVTAHNERASSLLSRTLTRERCILSIDDDIMNAQSIENIVSFTKGFGKREIEDLMKTLQKRMIQSKSEHGRLTYLDVWEVVDAARANRRLIGSSSTALEHSISMTNLQSEVDYREITVV